MLLESKNSRKGKKTSPLKCNDNCPVRYTQFIDPSPQPTKRAVQARITRYPPRNASATRVEKPKGHDKQKARKS